MAGRRAIGLCLLLLGLSGCDLITGNPPPVALIDASPTRGDAPLTVEFDGSLSFDPKGLLVRYEWDLGDGARTEGPKISHVYERNGIYLATLTVSDQFGASDQDRVRIVVGNPPPQAIFTASPVSGWPPLTVTFDGSVSFDPEGDPIAGYEWDFGDGKGASGSRVTHTYPQGGRFTAQLTITGRHEATSTATLVVHVLDFISTKDLRAGKSPLSVVTVDLDGDGRLDIAVANSESDEISLFFGASGASFIRDERISVGRRPVALTAADWDGDGSLDLAVAHLESGSVTLLFNDGNRGFDRRDEFRIGQWASAIASADFNRDGFSDLVVADASVDQVIVFLGDGKGGFEEPESVPVGRWPAALASGDFNGDGRIDLAVANFQADSITLLLGDGVGGFYEKGLLRQVGDGPVALATVDLNGDDLLDLVVANAKSGSLSVFPGIGDGRFRFGSEIPVGEDVHGLAVGDFDGDGSSDLATANSGADTVTVLLNDGVGGFGIPSQGRHYPTGGSPSALAAGDFDQDGFLDLVIVHFAGDRISILLNKL